MRITHFALDLGLRRQCRNRVDDDNGERARTHQHVGNLKRLFTRIRLRHQ